MMDGRSATLTSEQAKIGDKWSRQARGVRTRWWQSNRIKRHINRELAGIDNVGTSAGFNELLRQTGKVFDRAISVGCGIASKEAVLLRMGLVSRFDCYELSEARIRTARERSERLGLQERFSFHLEDAFKKPLPSDYDLVYWNNSLHHMMDVSRAIQWSRDRLRLGGYFAMDDFVGPTGFQWDDVHLHYVNSFRARLPDRMFIDPTRPPRRYPRIVRRPDPQRLWAKDPSEAADCGRILPLLREAFPGVRVVPTGGAIYHTALNNIIANFDEDGDADLIDEALYLDDFLRKLGRSNYAVALAGKL